ncbi:MAG: 50S ribosomal protein L13 [Candidatus Paceibacterota bacterium]
MQQEHTIDAQNRSLGRVASEAAKVLMGKHEASFERNAIAPVTVRIVNAGKSAITSKKLDEKVYMSYSGHPGGRTDRTRRKVVEQRGYGEVFRRSVYGMLPANRLRKQIMKNLVIEE